MNQKVKRRTRLAAALCFAIGVGLFVFSLPSPLPPQEIAAARTRYEEWSARQREDVTHGRASTAGERPPLVVETTPWSPALVVVSFLFCICAIVLVIQTVM